VARIFERRRDEVIEFVSARLINATDSRASEMVRRYCSTYDIPATEQDISDMATEAVRRRMVAKIKDLSDTVAVLSDRQAILNGRVTTLENQLVSLYQKVNSFHP
jgi:hypothetical protein